MNAVYVLGCTARRAGLGIHRTQAGRRGSRLGRVGGWRPAALRLRRRSTPSPPPLIPAAGRPGGAARVLGLAPARARNHHHRSRPPQRARARCTTVTFTVTGPPQRLGGGAPSGTTQPGRGTRLRHRTRPPLRAGDGAARAGVRAGPRGPLTLPHVADCRVATRALRGAGSPDCIAIAGPGAARPDVGGGGSAGAATSPSGSPRATFTVWDRGLRRLPDRGPPPCPPPCQPGRIRPGAARASPLTRIESEPQPRRDRGVHCASSRDCRPATCQAGPHDRRSRTVEGPVRAESVGDAPPGQEPGPRPC